MQSYSEYRKERDKKQRELEEQMRREEQEQIVLHTALVAVGIASVVVLCLILEFLI